MTTKPIIVIGAGIVGASTTLWLQRFGHEVILIDKGAPGMGASYGNAGLIAQWGFMPVTTPGLWRKLPGYLLNPNSPLFMKWGYFPKLVPWLTRFMSHTTDAETRRIVGALLPLVGDAVADHKALVRGTGLEQWIADSKLGYAYTSRRAFEADGYGWEMKRAAGFSPRVLTGAAVREEEPILGEDFQCLAVLEGQGHVLHPGQYVAALVDHVTERGGRFIQAEVKGFQRDQGRISRVETDQGAFNCQAAVVTAGIWSKEMMQMLGLKVQLETERGYHVLFENPSELPRNPMMISTGAFGVTPMTDGLRCAGTVELGDHHAGPSDGPVKLIRREAKRAFPRLSYSGTQEWMGFRPSTPDSLPLIGQIGDSGLYTGFGHQHLGLTAGPRTGQLLAQMISGAAPNVDLAPYDPARYLR